MFNKDKVTDDLKMSGRFQIEHWRDDELLATLDIHNDITTEGKNALLDIAFHNDTQIEIWYLGLVDVTNFTAVANTDTYDEIDGTNGWDEFKDYEVSANATARAEWEEDAAAAGVISNTTVAQFDITGAGTVWGVFLSGGGANAELQGDHAADGSLWSTANFTANVVVANTDVLKATYSITA